MYGESAHVCAKNSWYCLDQGPSRVHVDNVVTRDVIEHGFAQRLLRGNAQPARNSTLGTSKFVSLTCLTTSCPPLAPAPALVPRTLTRPAAATAAVTVTMAAWYGH